MRAVLLFVVGMFVAAAVLCVSPSGAGAATASERPALSIDRTNRALTDAEWDELQHAMRLKATSTVGAQFNQATTPDILMDPAAVNGDRCGFSMALGDVNGDGLLDVLLGCPGESSYAGDAILFTKNAGVGFTYDSTLTNPSPAANDNCGWGVALGDIDGDGRDDALIGCYQDDTGFSNAGNALVFTRNAGTGFTYDSTLVDPAPAVNRNCGWKVALGDVTGDGLADAIVGCPNQDGNGVDNKVLYFTKNAGSGFTFDSVLSHADVPNGCGFSLGMGDANGDGRLDVFVGCTVLSSSKYGGVQLYTKNAGAGFTWESSAYGTMSWEECGYSLSVADINDDGLADLAVGCADTNGTPTNPGGVFANGGYGRVIVFTKNAGTGFTLTDSLYRPSRDYYDYCGKSVSFGDVNSDGRMDILMGCPSYATSGGNSSGLTVLFLKNAGAGYTNNNNYRDPSPAANQYCGFALQMADVNGDGHDDAVIGCFGKTSYKGEAVVYDLQPPATLIDPSPAASDVCGSAIAFGDVNGDGLSDVLVGCSGNSTNRGNALLFTKNTETGYTYQSALVDPSAAASDKCGISVALADINNDGLADALMGCSGDTSGRGNVLAYLSTGTGFTYDSAMVDPAAAAGDACGISIAVNDVNIDGRADVLVGCNGDTSAAGNALVFTKNTGTGFTYDSTLTDPAPVASDKCGTAVDFGDADGDGRADALIGCSGDTSNRGNALVFTKNSGAGFTYDSTLTDPSAAASDACGTSVVFGDVDADGKADALIGCQGDNSSRGNALVFIKNSGAGFTYDSTLTDPAPAASDKCGISVAFGDVNGDGRPDAFIGCSGNNSARGNALVFHKNAGSGFTYDTALVDPAAAASDVCGTAVGVFDADGDGRADAFIGCSGNSSSRGNVLAYSADPVISYQTSGVIHTQQLNHSAGPLLSTTVTPSVSLNGGTLSLEASPDGGTTWEPITSGVAHWFIAFGNDLRLRATMNSSTTHRKTPYIYGLAVDYAYSLDAIAPTPNPMTGTSVANSATQITWTASTATDETALNAAPYSIDAGTPTWQASPTFVESGLSANTQYTRTVRARDQVGNTSTGTLTRWTLTNAPTSASAVAANWNATDTYAISLSWSAPSGGATSYNVRSSADAYASVLTTSATTSKLITGLTANTAYSYKICAVNPDGVQEATCSSIVTATTPPAAPTSPASSSITDTSASFSWTAATGATKYKLVVSLNASCAVGANVTIDPATSPQSTGALLRDRVYTFNVTSYSTASLAYGPPSTCTALSSTTQRTAITASVDSTTKNLGSAAPGATMTGSTTITTSTYGAPGYTIDASVDQQLTNGGASVPATTSGSIAVPGTWSGTGFGFTISSATSLAAKWSSGTKYAAFTTTPTQIHTTGAAFTANTANSTNTVVDYRLVAPSTQAIGSYGLTVTYTVLPTA